MSPVGQSNWLIFFIHNSLRTHFHSSHAPIRLFHHSAASSCPSCVLVGVFTRERVSGACFRSKLPRVHRPLEKNVYFRALKTSLECLHQIYVYIYAAKCKMGIQHYIALYYASVIEVYPPFHTIRDFCVKPT